MPRHLVAVTSASVVLAASVLLTGCQVPLPAPIESPSPSPTASSTSSPTPSAEPSETPTAGSTPVDIPCDTLVSLQTMYDFNPNFSMLGAFTPGAGTPAATAASADGTICRWKNDTSGDAIDVSVASFDAATLGTMADAAAAAGTPVSGFGDEAYFSSTGGVGQVTAFSGAYWVVVRSVAFFEAGDAAPLMSSVLAAL